jgi:hypothetical protein
VYHGEHGLRTLKELARSYLTITRDLTRVMTRIKAIYRSWAIPCAGPQVYALGHRAEWLAKLSEGGVRRRLTPISSFPRAKRPKRPRRSTTPWRSRTASIRA